MKKLLIASVLIFGAKSYASVVEIKCGPSAKLPTGSVATVEGSLNPNGKTAEGYKALEGTLSVKAGATLRKPVIDVQDLEVVGVTLDDGSLHLMPKDDSELSALYINGDSSYIEVNGLEYRTDCSK